MPSKPLEFFCVLLLTIGLVACATVNFGDSAPPPGPQLAKIVVTPPGPGLSVGGLQQFSATGTYTNGDMKDLTSKVTWNSSAPTTVSVNSTGQAQALAAGQVTITAASGSVHGATAISVVPVPAAPPALDGNYAFTFTAVDSRGPQYYAGSFHANPPDAAGNGIIDSGTEDANTSAGVSSVALTGTYSIYPDGRGTMVLTPAGLSSTTFRFILAASGTAGMAIQFDGQGTAAGSFELQDPSAFHDATLSGNFVFRLNGIDASLKTMGEIGLFTADGAGNLTAGSVDVNDFGVLAFSSLTGSYTIGGDGRGTVTVTTSAGAVNFVMYVVSATKIILMGTDSILAGCAEKQANQTFSVADLSSGYAYLVNRAPASDLNTFDIIGRATFDGRGNIPGGTQEEVALLTQNNITGGTYSVSADGRGSMQITTDNGNRSYRFYMLSPTRIYLLDTFTTWAGTGPADSQVAMPTNSTLSGTYALSGSSIGQNDTGLSMRLTADGAGNFTGVADLVQNGVPASVVVNATYQVTDNGRTFVLPERPVGAESFIFYVVSEQQAQMLGSQPTVDGALRLQ